jgi:hypothetical protein
VIGKIVGERQMSSGKLNTTETMTDDEESRWSCTIERVENGYLITFNDNSSRSYHVIEENENDPLADHERLLWWLMDYFAFNGTKHDSERLRIVREKRDH